MEPESPTSVTTHGTPFAAAIAMLGLASSILRIRGWPLSFGMAFFMLYPMIVHLPLHTEARYTAAARPLLLMFAAATLHWPFVRYGAHRAERRQEARRIGA